jgi:uncharacterized protein (TIGR03435 family)
MKRLLILGAAACLAQSSFDVASIRPHPEGILATLWRIEGERFTFGDARLKTLIRYAYGFELYQIVDAPKWADEAGYDIQAKSTSPLTEAAAKTMVQSLLAERFDLRFHLESRETDVFLLTSKGQPKLTPRSPGSLATPPGMIWAKGISMADLVLLIPRVAAVGRPVLDRTGLAGTYEFTLEFASTQDQPGASIFSAIQEQLNLKLESAKVPMEVIVIDRVGKPSEN